MGKLNTLTDQRLNEDGLTQLGADTQTGVAHQANEVRLPAEELYLLLFTQAKLAQAVNNFRRSSQPLDAHRCARHYPAQRTKKRVRVARAFSSTG